MFEKGSLGYRNPWVAVQVLGDTPIFGTRQVQDVVRGVVPDGGQLASSLSGTPTGVSRVVSFRDPALDGGEGGEQRRQARTSQ